MGWQLVHSRGSDTLEIGITFKSHFKSFRNILVTKDWIISLEIGIVIVLKYFLRGLVEVLFGQIDFLNFNVLVMSSTSLGSVCVEKKVFSDGFIR